MDEIKNPNSHIFLYAKGWYVQSNIIEDMKAILGHRSGIGHQYIGIDDIISVLSEIVYPILCKKENLFMELLMDITPSTRFCYADNIISLTQDEIIIKKLLSILRFSDKEFFKELDAPDCKILPLTNHTKFRAIKENCR